MGNKEIMCMYLKKLGIIKVEIMKLLNTLNVIDVLEYNKGVNIGSTLTFFSETIFLSILDENERIKYNEGKDAFIVKFKEEKLFSLNSASKLFAENLEEVKKLGMDTSIKIEDVDFGDKHILIGVNAIKILKIEKEIISGKNSRNKKILLLKSKYDLEKEIYQIICSLNS